MTKFTCVDCGKKPLVFENHGNIPNAEEYEPDLSTGEKRCFSCDLLENPTRWEEV